MSIDFANAIIPPDTIPETSDVEYPCRVCGKESGPYGGRGPKPRYCPEHKKGAKKSPTIGKVTGAPATLAAQATGVLVQVNGMIALGITALGLFQTAHALADANTTFEEQAYQALLTDPELCKLILKGGVKSAKFSLTLAYAGVGVAVGPTAINELKERKAVRDAMREAEADEAGA